LVEIKDVRDKLPQEETDSRNVIRKLPKKTAEEVTEEEKAPEETKRKRKPKGSLVAPKEYTEVIGLDGTPALVEVEEVHVVENIGPDGSRVLVEVPDLKTLPKEKQNLVTKVKKIKSKPSKDAGDIPVSIPFEDVLEESPEIVYTEETGPEGKPILVKGTKRLVKKTKPKSDDISELPTEIAPED
ncbi:unnamed protein product, partial [Allacma fusca]